MQSGDRRPGVATFDCRGLGSTVDGSISLRNPFSSSSPMSQNTRQRDDLNPRRKKRRGKRTLDSDNETIPNVAGPSLHKPSFMPATNIYNNPLSGSETKQNPFQFTEWKPIFKKAKVSPQKNNLFNYQFTKTSPEKKTEGMEVKVEQEDADSDVEILYTVEPPKEKEHAAAASGSNQESIKKESHRQSKNPDPYGLLGLDHLSDFPSDSDFDECTASDGLCPDIFSQLPEYVLESVFAFMPLTDLLLNVSLVCSRFRDIIHNPKFLQWKKRYHGLKCERDEAITEVQEVVRNCGVDGLHKVLPCLPNCLVSFRRVSHENDQDMLRCLKSHSKFHWAIKFIQENCPDCSPSPDKDPNPWSVIGALVALSDSVSDVSKILQLLSLSTCPIQDVMEALYCLACVLFHTLENHKALYGPHYYVFYALYLYENEWQAKASDLQAGFYSKGQQNILKYSQSETSIRMTHEQMRIVNHPLRENQIVKVVAFAGTGKTSTLVHFAKMRQGMKFLLLVYNKAAQLHSSRVFPGNVECRTMSSMAFSEGPGQRFKRKLTSKLRPLDILRHLETKVKMDRNTYARHVLTTIEKFMSSSDPRLTLAHALSCHSGPDEEPITDEIALCVVRDAEIIWSKMVNPSDFDVRLVHDAYLKLYQLEQPVWNDYACIMVDEAQDCTPAMLDIVLTQKCPKILVGDPNQQIYSFRGAVNALENVESTHIYYLTQSFRFGPEIAYVAHCALAVLKNVIHKTLVGGKQKSRVNGEHEGQIAIIARCNATLFREAVRLLCKGHVRPHEPLASEIRGAFVGGISGYNLSQLVDIYNLMRRSGSIKDKFISRFQSFQHLQIYAKKARDVELNGKVTLVLAYEHNIPEYVKTITNKCSKYDLKFANVVFSTAHKAKGLEFDTVCLTDDYSFGVSGYSEKATIKHLLSMPGLTNPSIASEFNVLYVALTRAKKCLLLSEPLRLMLLAAQESFESLSLLKSEQEICLFCKNALNAENSKSFVLHRKPLTMMNGSVRSTGFYCKECARPIDEKDLNSGFCIVDKTRHAYSNILGTQVKRPHMSIFDSIEIFLL